MTLSVPESGTRHRNRFWPFFWITILFLLAIYLYAELRVSKLRTDAQGQVMLAPHVVPSWDRVVDEILAHQEVRINDTARGEIDALIEQEIDEAFAPIFGQISKLADFHYSVMGEYTELGAAFTGTLADSIGTILFAEVDFPGRLKNGIGNIFAGSGKVLSEALDDVNRELGERMDFSPEEMQVLVPAMELTLQDIEARFSEISLGLRSAGATLGGVTAGTLLVKVTGKKVAGKLAGKLAFKAGAKVAGVASGGALGAAAGSVVPGLGTAVGGIVGAALVWLATDKAVVEADEYLNRDAFEASLAALIDAEKARIKVELSEGYAVYLSRIVEHTRTRLQDLRPVDLIEER